MPLIANAISDIIANADAAMKAIKAFFGAFIDGDLDSLATHTALVAVIVAAEIGLGVGIWLEFPKDKKFREWLGLALVLGGCVFSVVATVLLLIFDEGISRAQQSTIIALETRLAPRELTPKQQDAFKAAVEPYSGQQYMVSVAFGGEPGALMCTLNMLLKDAGRVTKFNTTYNESIRFAAAMR